MPEPQYADDPMRELGDARRAFVLPDLKVMYVSVGKNGCTSIKWMIAEAAGENLRRLRPTIGAQPNRSAGVHQREIWQTAFRMHELGEAGRKEISPENGWYVFGVVRDPRLRLFSAWESKYLLRNPIYWRQVDRDWAPRVPTKPEHVIDDFAKFVFSLSDDPNHEVPGMDSHFRKQVDLLAEHLVPYSRIYDISELDTMVRDLSAHLRGQGHHGQLSLRRSNDTPLPPNRLVFQNGVREAIEKFYAPDFERFGERWDFSRIESREMNWTSASFAHVESLVEAHQRIGDQARAASRLRRRKKVLTEKVARLEKRVERQRKELRRLRAPTSS